MRRRCWQFWRKLRARMAARRVAARARPRAPRVTLPAALSPDLADDLPEGPGRLSLLRRGREGGETLLYVGKANNLRERVLDHFRDGAHEAQGRCGSPRRCGA